MRIPWFNDFLHSIPIVIKYHKIYDKYRIIYGGIKMNNELVGQLIVFSLISLIIGGLGFVQYKSDIPLNVGFNKHGYDSKVVSKIVGLHVMIFAVVLFILPIVFYRFKEMEHYQTIGAVIMIILAILMILSIDVTINRTAKLSSKAKNQ